jgi:hypothetical protein
VGGIVGGENGQMPSDGRAGKSSLMLFVSLLFGLILFSLSFFIRFVVVLCYCLDNPIAIAIALSASFFNTTKIHSPVDRYSCMPRKGKVWINKEHNHQSQEEAKREGHTKRGKQKQNGIYWHAYPIPYRAGGPYQITLHRRISRYFG